MPDLEEESEQDSNDIDCGRRSELGRGDRDVESDELEILIF